jgi:hypothetical protein
MEVNMTHQHDPNRPLIPDAPVQPLPSHDRDLDVRPQMAGEDNASALGTLAVVVLLAALAIGAIMYYLSDPAPAPNRQTSVQERTTTPAPTPALPRAPQQ